ncbi:MFS general substrate transporter [Acrodontium crateriforme]|uniref:MFS general substrate transporter n=1 Tax=Acrodontium crateriforme TaxID=150365 RepID=A0AAQ3MDQ8_9PEZI|nr:MFS general substrate transporter [Acrodontium crateriforme]
MVDHLADEKHPDDLVPPEYRAENLVTGVIPLEDTSKPRWERIRPALACGAGLFSDGYLQSVIGPVNTCFKLIYGDEYKKSTAAQNVSAIAFAGTVVGQLVFGYTSDKYSRKWSLMVSTIILFVFAVLGAGAYGYHGSHTGLFAALTAYRFLLGIGIGGEYPAGSVGCAESSGELKAGHRNRWFVLFTNVQIDIGFIIGVLVPMIVARITDNLEVVWRVSLGIGLIPPLSLMYLRLKLKEPEAANRETFRQTRLPYWLALKFYGPRLAVVCTIWFIYDFLTYPFSIYSTTFIQIIQPKQALWQTFGWSVLINFFYLPGALIGSWVADWLGPQLALSIFVAAQGILGFIMAACEPYLATEKYVGAFVVVFGVFLMLGEIGPGDNIGLIASKSCATGIRGQYYAIAAALGKVGALVGTYIFPIIIADGGDSVTKQNQYPFWVASSLCLFSATIVWLLPKINQDTIEQEDAKFRAYLTAHGYDVSKMGTLEWQEKRRESVSHNEYVQ